MKNAVNRLLCRIGLAKFCQPRQRVPSAEQMAIRLRQERLLIRLEALGVEADVLSRRVADESL